MPTDLDVYKASILDSWVAKNIHCGGLEQMIDDLLEGDYIIEAIHGALTGSGSPPYKLVHGVCVDGAGGRFTFAAKIIKTSVSSPQDVWQVDEITVEPI